MLSYLIGIMLFLLYMNQGSHWQTNDSRVKIFKKYGSKIRRENLKIKTFDYIFISWFKSYWRSNPKEGLEYETKKKYGQQNSQNQDVNNRLGRMLYNRMKEQGKWMRKRWCFGETERCVHFVAAHPCKCKDLMKMMMLLVSSYFDLPFFSSWMSLLEFWWDWCF